MNSNDRDFQLRASWETNAEAWTSAVREGAIASRRAGTDAAVLAACAPFMPGRALDVGCGEGWLTRALAGRGAEALGVDASEALIERARAAGGGARYEVASYEALVADPAVAAGPWAVIVCNFALLGDPLSPLLAALGARLAPEGRLVVQTMHPWMAIGDGGYRGEWRVETFAGFGSSFAAQAPWAPMPWYYRPLASWIEEIARADLYVDTLAEPLHPETGRPLSLLLTCARRTQLP